MADVAAISVWELAGGLRAPAAARQSVRQALEGVVEDEVLEVVVLLTSEIVTNAVDRDGAGAVVTMELGPATVVVTVADSRPDSPALTGLARAVVDDLDLSWGAHVHRSGKAVWFELPIASVGAVTEGGAGAGTVHA
ncbi:MAG: serine phosphatase RsbU, regulator of sigma subunit [Actinomycetia bacterium]|nr:serine phosphatase RsbU, regulator of sigma subunit [Actinomycetes bacterium]